MACLGADNLKRFTLQVLIGKLEDALVRVVAMGRQPAENIRLVIEALKEQQNG